MARIRSIKPEFWTDSKVVRLTPLARLLFIGLWNFADDEGRMPFEPLTIKLQVFPLDSSDLSGELGELRGNSLVTVYEIGGREYLQISNFQKHQKIDKRTSSKFPPPPPNSAEFPRVPPTEGKGMEGKGEERRGDDHVVVRTREEFSVSPPLRPQPASNPDHRAVRDFIVRLLPRLATKMTPEIDEWLAEGCDFTEDIKPTVELLIAQKGGDIGSFKFFTTAILSAKRAREELQAQHQRLREKYRD